MIPFRMLWLCVLLVAVPLHAAEPPVTEIIPTTQSAERLLPLLQPLAGDDVSVQAYRGQLILRGPATRVAELRALLGQLDQPLQNLRISVRRASSGTQAGSVDRLHVQRGSVDIDSRRDSLRAGGTEIRQITMLEGTPAWLSVDEEVPVIGMAPSGALFESYMPLGNALELVPYMAGDRVRLQVRQRTARRVAEGIQASTVATEIMVTPGAWVAIGDVVDQEGADNARTSVHIDNQGGGIDHRRVGGQQSAVRWEVKVDVLGR